MLVRWLRNLYYGGAKCGSRFLLRKAATNSGANYSSQACCSTYLLRSNSSSFLSEVVTVGDANIFSFL